MKLPRAPSLLIDFVPLMQKLCPEADTTLLVDLIRSMATLYQGAALPASSVQKKILCPSPFERS